MGTAPTIFLVLGEKTIPKQLQVVALEFVWGLPVCAVDIARESDYPLNHVNVEFLLPVQLAYLLVDLGKLRSESGSKPLGILI